jgi:hypothetical protein
MLLPRSLLPNSVSVLEARRCDWRRQVYRDTCTFSTWSYEGAQLPLLDALRGVARHGILAAATVVPPGILASTDKVIE